MGIEFPPPPPPDPNDNTAAYMKELGKLAAANSNDTSSRSSSSLIGRKLRKLLQEFYSPFNKELVELLQDTRFDWGY